MRTDSSAVGGRGVSSAARPVATGREDLVTTVLSAWLVAALFSDGWAHHNVPDLEGFFTPWHAALYAGFLALSGWLLRVGGGAVGKWPARLPGAYRSGLAGVATFAVGGFADMLWHLALGVEEGIDALVSPTHLLLLAGGMLLTTTALRSRWAASDTSSPVALAALAVPTSLAAFFLLYVSEFTAAAPTVALQRLPESDPLHTAAELPATAGLAGFLVTTAVLVVPLLALWKRGPVTRPGSVTTVVATVSLLSVAVIDFDRPALWGALGAVVGAVAADVVVARADRRLLASSLRLPVLAAVTAALVWASHLVGLAVDAGLAWTPELWSGAVVLSMMAAGSLGWLATRDEAVTPAP